MSERRRGLGRGLGALLPGGPVTRESESRNDSPVDVFFPTRTTDDAVPRETTPPGAATAAHASDQEAPASDARDGATGPLQRGSKDLVPVDGAYFAELPVAAVAANPRQPRRGFDEEAMAELVHSVREVGLLQPVVVRPAGPDRYELVMGERRWRAASAAGLDTLPAIVRETADDALLRDALLENLHRSELNPLEEAAAYQQLLDDFGCTHEELAGRIGRSRPQISNTLRLLRLPPLVQRRVAAGVISAGHARALLGLTDGAAQERLAHRIVAEGLSVRTVEEIVTVGEGESERVPRRSRSPKPVAPRLADLAGLLSDRLDTRVKVTLGQRRGKITVEFATLEDLERIVGTLVPDAVAPDAVAPDVSVPDVPALGTPQSDPGLAAWHRPAPEARL